ncbi:hypothetical protein J3A83DRAFT_4373564 [Scleroderma citrinum]
MESPTAFEHKSSEGKLHSSSPLETLVRRTSSRRHAVKQREGSSQATAALPTPIPHFPPPRLSSDAASPPRPFANASVPDSPLLHSHFRSSAASAMTNGSVLHYYMNQHSKTSLHDCETDEGYYDENSLVHGEQEQRHISDRPRQSTDHSPQSALRQLASSSSQPIVLSTSEPGHFADGMKPSTSTVPTVVVSSPSDEVGSRTREPSRQPIASSSSPRLNFSRPGRPPILSSEEQKRQVLERNSRRPNSPRTTQTPSPHLPVVPLTGTYSDKNLSPDPYVSTPALPDALPSSSSRPTTSTSTLTALPPSLRAGPSSNVYSNPNGRHRPDVSEASTTSRHPSPQPPRGPTPTPSAENGNHPSPQPNTPLDYLQLGIRYHESNRLRDSAICFEKSAKEQGGCGVGMLMWGLALRHGWGCEKNEKSGFKWLTKAAEAATEDLEKARQGKGFNAKDVQEELVIAIYEVGQCFFQGWGVRKDQKMAVSYYRLAAKLGDMDAQQDLAFCLTNGKGCKKDKKEAAKWYRAAVVQGASDVGIAWIYKDKYRG